MSTYAKRTLLWAAGGAALGFLLAQLVVAAHAGVAIASNGGAT